MVISEEFWNLNIERKPIKRDGVTKLNAKRLHTSPKDDERELILENQIIVCLTFTHVILLKEKWENWKLIADPKELAVYLKDKREEISALIASRAEERLLKKDEMKKKGIEEFVMLQEDACYSLETDLFKVVTILENEKIDHLEVHKGPDPTIELLTNEQDTDPKTKKPLPDG